jgi:hypothetical protein
VSRTECTHEPLVVEAVLAGRWPDRADEALVRHARECEVCGDVATLATLMHDDHERSRFDVHVPAAGQVWWRAAIRARLESTQSAMQPLSWMHAITAAVAIGVLLAAITVASPFLAPLGDQLWLYASGYFPNAAVAGALASGLRLTAMAAFVGVIAVAVLVAAPLALYFVLSGD